MLFFNNKNKINNSLSEEHSPLNKDDLMKNCVVLQSIIDDSLKTNRESMEILQKQIDTLTSSLVDIRTKLNEYEKKDKILQKRKLDIGNAIIKGKPIVFTNEELAIINAKKVDLEGITAYVSATGCNKMKIEKDIVIGRSSTCDLSISDSSVSRIHAKISKREDGFWIEDLKSTNGTIIEGKKIEPERLYKLDKPYVINIGRTQIFFAFGSNS